MSSTHETNIDPALCESDSPITAPHLNTSPVLHDGTLVPKLDFEAQLYVLRRLSSVCICSPASMSRHILRQMLKDKTTLKAACDELGIQFAKRTTLAGFREKLINHWFVC